MNDRWPRPSYDDDDQPHFLFLLTPPYSGSTAISHILNTSRKTTLLHPKGEGQWLIPGLHETDRWDPQKPVDYESVKAVWLSEYQKIKRENAVVDTVIEKSPPNIVRISPLAAQFRSVSFLANNRDPYANCASILYRNHPADALSTTERIAILRHLAEEWVGRSQRIQSLTEELSCPLLTYEAFCSSREVLLGKLTLATETLASIDADADVQVKDYPPQKIRNQNPRQIALLSDGEIDEISAILASHAQTLDFFGYTLM